VADSIPPNYFPYLTEDWSRLWPNAFPLEAGDGLFPGASLMV
jgi:hypothetical protein